MSRYSSDSDSSNYPRKSRHKRRSSSSSVSESSRHRRLRSSKPPGLSGYKKSSKNHSSKSYGRSRSNSRQNSRTSRSSSKNRHKRQSLPRKKSKSKSHYKSRFHSKGHSSKYQSRSSSSDSKSSSSSTSSSSSSSTSSLSSSSSSSSSTSSKSSSGNCTKKKQFPTLSSSLNPEEQLREKLLKAIKAAESADHLLKQQGVLPKGVKSRNDISTLTNVKPQSDVIKDINADGFVQKIFTSSKQKQEKNFDELQISTGINESCVPNVDANSIFHASFFIDPKAKLHRWVRKLHSVRLRAISGEPLQ